MRIITYGMDNHVFLSDRTFDEAVSAWIAGTPYYRKSLAQFLPVPKTYSGSVREHDGLDIYYAVPASGSSFVPGIPGWLAIGRGRVYVRDTTSGKREWREVNVDAPSLLAVSRKLEKQEILDFVAKNAVILSVDEIVDDPKSEYRASLDDLLPGYAVPRT